MRKMNQFLAAVALFAVVNVSASSTPEPVNPTKTLATQIHEMLESNTFNVSEDLTAKVQFTINKDGEIVVLSVDTEDEALEGFVKRRLNYKKVELNNFREGKKYTVPVRITV